MFFGFLGILSSVQLQALSYPGSAFTSPFIHMLHAEIPH